MISIVGLGNVGSALKKTLEKYTEVVGYDKKIESDSFEALLECDLIFLCLPTPTSAGNFLNISVGMGQNLQAIQTTMANLRQLGYRGTVASQRCYQGRVGSFKRKTLTWLSWPIRNS